MTNQEVEQAKSCRSERERIKATRILWLDLETTGLDPLKDQILEVGALITDGFLNEISRCDEVIRASPETLAAMPPVVVTMHAESGLAARCLESNITIEQLDPILVAWFGRHGVTKASFLAGNSVGDFDRHFMRRLMPLTNGAISHRSINVSTFKALASIWSPEASAPMLNRKKEHRSILDCLHAIEELKFWLSIAEGFEFALSDCDDYAP